MNPLHFANLPQQQQVDMLYFQGDLLANRYEASDIFLLYSLKDFYVELRYDAYNNRLHEVSPFRANDERLEVYLPYLILSED